MFKIMKNEICEENSIDCKIEYYLIDNYIDLYELGKVMVYGIGIQEFREGETYSREFGNISCNQNEVKELMQKNERWICEFNNCL